MNAVTEADRHRQAPRLRNLSRSNGFVTNMLAAKRRMYYLEVSTFAPCLEPTVDTAT